MTKLTHTFVRIVATLATVSTLACAAEDDDDTATDPSLGTTNPSTTTPTTDTDDPSAETTDDPTTMTTDDPTTMTTDDPTTMTTDDPSDTGTECPMGSECMDDTMCAPGESCLGCLCIPGADTGTPTECGTNVSTMNVACDDCSHMNCCDEVQACFGDETVMMNTPCLELNNCIATDCTDAATAEAVQMCVDMNCPELADQFNTWVAFIGCVGMNCQAECAG